MSYGCRGCPVSPGCRGYRADRDALWKDGTTDDRTFAVRGPRPVPGVGRRRRSPAVASALASRPSQPPPYAGDVSALDDDNPRELVVAADGSIPADQLRKLGLLPGAHLGVVEALLVAAGGRARRLAPRVRRLGLGGFRAWQRASPPGRRNLVRVVAGSRAIVRYVQGSKRLSGRRTTEPTKVPWRAATPPLSCSFLEPGGESNSYRLITRQVLYR